MLLCHYCWRGVVFLNLKRMAKSTEVSLQCGRRDRHVADVLFPVHHVNLSVFNCTIVVFFLIICTHPGSSNQTHKISYQCMGAKEQWGTRGLVLKEMGFRSGASLNTTLTPLPSLSQSMAEVPLKKACEREAIPLKYAVKDNTFTCLK